MSGSVFWTQNNKSCRTCKLAVGSGELSYFGRVKFKFFLLSTMWSSACNLALMHCVLAGETAVFIGSDHRASTERLSANGKDAQTDLGSARLHPRDETSQ